MKNNKKTTYVLLIVVLGLWVVVFYRIYKSFFEDDSGPVLDTTVATKKVFVDQQETFIIQANYPDPFLGRVQAKVYRETSGTVKTSKPNKVVIPIKDEVKIDWSFIKYIGLIKNQQSKKQIALVSINGSEHMVSEGDIVENVSFLKNTKDSIKVSFQGKSIFIKK